MATLLVYEVALDCRPLYIHEASLFGRGASSGLGGLSFPLLHFLLFTITLAITSFCKESVYPLKRDECAVQLVLSVLS